MKKYFLFSAHFMFVAQSSACHRSERNMLVVPKTKLSLNSCTLQYFWFDKIKIHDLKAWQQTSSKGESIHLVSFSRCRWDHIIIYVTQKLISFISFVLWKVNFIATVHNSAGYITARQESCMKQILPGCALTFDLLGKGCNFAVGAL